MYHTCDISATSPASPHAARVGDPALAAPRPPSQLNTVVDLVPGLSNSLADIAIERETREKWVCPECGNDNCEHSQAEGPCARGGAGVE